MQTFWSQKFCVTNKCIQIFLVNNWAVFHKKLDFHWKSSESFKLVHKFFRLIKQHLYDAFFLIFEPDSLSPFF